MADLFEDSGGEDAGSPSPTELPATNGHSGLEDSSPEEPKSPASGAESHENGLQEEAEEDPEEYSERGPRDDIKVSVLRYQKTADDFTFDVEVCVLGGWSYRRCMM